MCQTGRAEEAACALPAPVFSSPNSVFFLSAPNVRFRPGPQSLNRATKTRAALFIFIFQVQGPASPFFLKAHFLLRPRGWVPSAACHLSDPTSSPVARWWPPPEQNQDPRTVSKFVYFLVHQSRRRIEGGVVCPNFKQPVSGVDLSPS